MSTYDLLLRFLEFPQSHGRENEGFLFTLMVGSTTQFLLSSTYHDLSHVGALRWNLNVNDSLSVIDNMSPTQRTFMVYFISLFTCARVLCLCINWCLARYLINKKHYKSLPIDVLQMCAYRDPVVNHSSIDIIAQQSCGEDIVSDYIVNIAAKMR